METPAPAECQPVVTENDERVHHLKIKPIYLKLPETGSLKNLNPESRKLDCWQFSQGSELKDWRLLTIRSAALPCTCFS